MQGLEFWVKFEYIYSIISINFNNLFKLLRGKDHSCKVKCPEQSPDMIHGLAKTTNSAFVETDRDAANGLFHFHVDIPNSKLWPGRVPSNLVFRYHHT